MDSDDDDKKDDSDFINTEDNEDESAEDYDDDEQDSTDSEEEEGNQSNLHEKRNQENHVETRVLSIAQDLVYSVSGGRVWTPKHIGLGSSLYQARRSNKLVQTFHNAGHIISYRDIRQVDTALAKHTLSTMNTENGAVTPVNLAEGRFTHFTADNIDINEGTLDGQNTFHATQYAAWQRGPESVGILQNIMPTKSTTLKVPDESFNQKHVVLTVDQALFPLLMELKWTLPDYKDTLIPRLGGLHTSMNFLKVLGQHIQDSGLPTIWIESGILGPRTVERDLAGKITTRVLGSTK